MGWTRGSWRAGGQGAPIQPCTLVAVCHAVFNFCLQMKHPRGDPWPDFWLQSPLSPALGGARARFYPPAFRTNLFIAAIINSPLLVPRASPATPRSSPRSWLQRVFWEFFVILVNMCRRAPRSCSTLGTLHFRFKKSPKTLISGVCLTPMKL